MNSQAELKLTVANDLLSSARTAVGQVRLAVISDAAPERNGVGAYYQDLLQQLMPRLEDARLFSPTIARDKWQAGLVLPLPGDSTQKLCMPNPWQLHRQLKSFKPNVIIVATPGAYGLTGAFLASRLSVPVLVGFHTSFEHLTELYWQDSWRGKLVQHYFRQSHAYLFRKAEQVLANSKAMCDLAGKMGSCSTELVGTPIASAFAGSSPEKPGGGFRRVLFAGRLAAEKNIGAVLHAARNLPDIQFNIAGDGPLRAEIESAAADITNLAYLGWLGRDELRQQVDNHDALVLPSHFESFGTIALEAMARARLVVVSHGCGIAQWPELRDSLYVIEEGHTLEQKLKQLTAATPESRQETALHAHAAAMALNEHSLNQWCDLLVKAATSAARGSPEPAI